MARECKAKRDEKRFGKPERLADKIVGGHVGLAVPSWSKLPPAQMREWVFDSAATCREMIGSSVIVVADNVAEYHYSVCSRTHLDWTKDFPSCRPPFSRLFLEFRRPPFYRDDSGCVPFNSSFPEQWGQIVDMIPACELPRTTGYAETDEWLIPMLDIPGVAYILRFTSVELLRGDLLPGAIFHYLPIDESGGVVGHPQTLLSCSLGADSDFVFQIIDDRGQFLQTAMLAISFMNFQNIPVNEIEPDPKLNRERRKAGLKPFLRYHTIDIGPVREVLRSQGQVETRGLKHALHQCRGHFAIYATSFMGRRLEKPMIVWRPAHVRGSAKQGVVISDYNVKAPSVS